MGNGRNPSINPDRFSMAQKSEETSLPPKSEPTPPLRKDEPATAASPSYALPTNLPSALRHFDDDQLERLLAAVIAERQTGCGKKNPVPAEPSRKKRIKEVAVPLAQGKLNAIRAAFKAGVRPSRIARQFTSQCSVELREYLSQIPSEKIGSYVERCLTTSFDKGGMVLQDLVNELGRRLWSEPLSKYWFKPLTKV